MGEIDQKHRDSEFTLIYCEKHLKRLSIEQYKKALEIQSNFLKNREMSSLLMDSDQIQIENYNQREIKLQISSMNLRGRQRKKYDYYKKEFDELEKTPKESKKRKISNSITQGKLLEETLKSQFEANQYLQQNKHGRSFEHFCEIILHNALKPLLKFVNDHRMLRNKKIDFTQ